MILHATLGEPIAIQKAREPAHSLCSLRRRSPLLARSGAGQSLLECLLLVGRAASFYSV